MFYISGHVVGHLGFILCVRFGPVQPTRASYIKEPTPRVLGRWSLDRLNLCSRVKHPYGDGAAVFIRIKLCLHEGSCLIKDYRARV